MNPHEHKKAPSYVPDHGAIHGHRSPFDALHDNAHD